MCGAAVEGAACGCKLCMTARVPFARLRDPCTAFTACRGSLHARVLTSHLPACILAGVAGRHGGHAVHLLPAGKHRPERSLSSVIRESIPSDQRLAGAAQLHAAGAVNSGISGPALLRAAPARARWSHAPACYLAAAHCRTSRLRPSSMRTPAPRRRLLLRCRRRPRCCRRAARCWRCPLWRSHTGWSASSCRCRCVAQHTAWHGVQRRRAGLGAWCPPVQQEWRSGRCAAWLWPPTSPAVCLLSLTCLRQAHACLTPPSTGSQAL